MSLTKLLARRTLTSDCLQIYNELRSSGSAAAEVYRVGGRLHGVLIDFRGALAHFPSTSNDREIYPTFVRSQKQTPWRLMTRRGWQPVRPAIRHSDRAIAHFEAAKDAYIAAVTERGAALPQFGTQRIDVMLLLANPRRRSDSHNSPKPFGDWMEKAGLTDNDTHAEIDARRKSDLLNFENTRLDPRLGRGSAWAVAALRDASSTTLVIQLREQTISRIQEENVYERFAAATGSLQLVG